MACRLDVSLPGEQLGLFQQGKEEEEEESR